MNIDSPSNVLRIAAGREGVTDDGTHYLLRMRRDRSVFFRANRDSLPTLENYAAVASYLSEITGLSIESDEAKQLLSLYPYARIKLADIGRIEDSDVKDELSFLVAHFFLGCSWPTMGDSVDMNAFIDLLQGQAILMGYKRNEGA